MIEPSLRWRFCRPPASKKSKDDFVANASDVEAIETLAISTWSQSSRAEDVVMKRRLQPTTTHAPISALVMRSPSKFQAPSTVCTTLM